MCVCVFSAMFVRKMCKIFNDGNSIFHCMKSVQIRSFSWSLFFHIRTTENMRKYGPEKTLYFDNFHAVSLGGAIKKESLHFLLSFVQRYNEKMLWCQYNVNTTLQWKVVIVCIDTAQKIEFSIKDFFSKCG